MNIFHARNSPAPQGRNRVERKTIKTTPGDVVDENMRSIQNCITHEGQSMMFLETNDLKELLQHDQIY